MAARTTGPAASAHLPPGAAERIAWPDSFGTRFAIFVDTEEEFDWRAPLARENRSVSAIAALPAAHRRFADRGVPLTYMIDHPVAADGGACDVLRRLIEDGRSTIGTQLHPWVNPPFDEAVTPHNSFAGHLPERLEAAKIDVLTAAIVAGTGVRPVAYRAGRYGIGPATLRLLAARGYALDSSMRARYDYRSGGGPDFAAIGNAAFRRDGMIELPLTTVFTGWGRSAGERLYPLLGAIAHARGIAARARMLSRVALTPEDMPLADALEAIRIALGEGVRVLNFSFHSPSVTPGHTPYVRDADDLAEFFAWWDAVLDLLEHRCVAPASLAELIAAAG